MKKSIKYAGIAAATLLAVAPVAAPALSTVSTTVKAADNNTDATKAANEMSDFKGQFANIDNSTDITNALSDQTAVTGMQNFFGERNAKDITAVQTNSNVQKLMKNVLKAPTFDTLTKLHTQVYFTAKDASGKTYNGVTDGQTPAELAKTMGLDSRMPVTIYVHFVSSDLDTTINQKAGDSDFSFDINKTNDNELKTINAGFATPLSVAKNSKTLATQLVNTNDVTLKDQDGDSVLTDSVQFGKSYFTTYSKAMDAAKVTNPAYDPANDKLGNVSANDIKDNEFKTAGTYYQVVTYNAQPGSALEGFINEYTTNQDIDSDYSVYVNGKQASAGYDFVATKLSQSNRQRISFVRAINVSDSEAQWTESAADGIVTTKNDTPYYTLKNNNNDRIKNRALAQNTAWKTDKMRTDQDGNKQYRVATGEWIDANDVTFGDTATTDTGALTDIKSVKGVVKLDNAGFTYFLYNKAGDQLKTRALSGNSSWQVINTAKDSEGNTYYRVATDEWVMQGNGVTFN